MSKPDCLTEDEWNYLLDRVLKESEPSPIEDFDPTCLLDSEWMALADNADKEVWIWSQMAKYEKDEQKKVKYEEHIKDWQEKAREYRMFAAIESALQEKSTGDDKS